MSAEHGVAMTMARFRARQIVKERWLAKGRRMAEVLPRDVIGWAEDYIAEHPAMLVEALEMVRQSPELATDRAKSGALLCETQK